MKRTRSHLLAGLLAASLGLLALAPSVHAAGAPGASAASAPDAVSAFNRLKQLEGEWQGTTDSGTPIVLRYHVQAGGTTLMETQAPGTSEEMVSIYSITGNDLVMHHFCPMGVHGNQPRFRLESTQPNTLEFTFTGGENFDPAKDTHVHGGRFVFLPDGRLERHWTINDHGKQAGTERFLLSRKP
ncbi:MAG TPA: hypothetical protein VGR07_10650 [Thermoanaerobaculia bacterium]|nr:hypothetical protein [Thermoanaerobaculia bacterium]